MITKSSQRFLLLFSLILLSLFASVPNLLTLHVPSASAQLPTLIGFSVTPSSLSDCQDLIDDSEQYGSNAIRLAFSTSVISGSRTWHQEYVQYFLDHSSLIIILDPEHMYPPTLATANTFRSNLATVKTELLSRVLPFNGNPRVLIEMLNEFNDQTYFYSVSDELADYLRAHGITNQLGVNLPPSYSNIVKYDAKLDFQGYHFYFNSWSASGAMSWINTALSKGITLINTEQGANDAEPPFTSTQKTYLNSYLDQCFDKGVGNLVWLNYYSKNGLRKNLNAYESLPTPYLVMPTGTISTTVTGDFYINNQKVTSSSSVTTTSNTLTFKVSLTSNPTLLSDILLTIQNGSGTVVVFHRADMTVSGNDYTITYTLPRGGSYTVTAQLRDTSDTLHTLAILQLPSGFSLTFEQLLVVVIALVTLILLLRQRSITHRTAKRR